MRFYDVPEIYDLFYSPQYHEECKSFFSAIFGKKKFKDILDCAVGTGQMLIPLAQMGYNVSGIDINGKMIGRATRNFASAQLFAKLSVGDFRNIKEKIRSEFDCVMCTGNSLAHVRPVDLEMAIRSMDSVIRPGGMLYIDSKNWDHILQKKQRFYLFNPIIRDKGRVNYMQVWDYLKDESIVFNYLITEEIENKIVSKRQFYEMYYPFSLDAVREILSELNYTNIFICKLGDHSQTDLDRIEWYALTAEKGIE
jgi:ubiquinone/menaquinone biosynthesis C-methylase UbiE